MPTLRIDYEVYSDMSAQHHFLAIVSCFADSCSHVCSGTNAALIAATMKTDAVCREMQYKSTASVSPRHVHASVDSFLPIFRNQLTYGTGSCILGFVKQIR